VETPKTMGLEAYILAKINHIPTHLKITFVASMLFFLLVHSFGFSSKFVNEDALFHFHSSLAYLYRLGRWAIVGLQYIRGFYVAPWIIGVFAMLYFAVAITLLVSVLEIKNNVHCVIVALLVTSFPAWANQFMYDFMADAYPAALLMAVLAIYFAKKYKYGFVVGAFFLMLSLALYQAFLAFSVGLSLIAVIRFTLEEQRPIKQIMAYGSKFLWCGILGLVLYFTSVNVALIMRGSELTDYQGMSSFGQLSLGELPGIVRDTYLLFFLGFYPTRAVVYPSIENNLYVSVGLFFLYATVFFVMVYIFVHIIVRKRIFRQVPALLVLTICLLALPLALNIARMIAPLATFHILMTNAFVLSLVFLFVLLDIYDQGPHAERAFLRTGIHCVALVVTVLISGNYMRQSSSFYLVQHIQYERTFAFYNRLVMRIESTPGYEPGMPIAFIGSAPFPSIGISGSLRREIRQIVGFCDTRPAVGLGEDLKMFHFIQIYLGVQLRAASWEQIDYILNSEIFMNMPLYPRYGSVATINNVLVVRFN